ncbi:MAG: hypothetical protein AAFQ41_14975, partial [Cyanobacteria bacterium J06623_7]
MKTIFNQLFLLTLLLLTGCSGVGSSPPATSTSESGVDWQKNPVAAIQKAIEIGKKAEEMNAEYESREPVEPISFKELLEYLPDPPSGWTAQEPEGATNSLGNYSISQVSQTYTQESKTME